MSLNEETQNTAGGREGKNYSIWRLLRTDPCLANATVGDLEGEGEQCVNIAYQTALSNLTNLLGITCADPPRLRIVEGEKMAFDFVDNEICVGKEEFMDDIFNSMGEEVAHYLREKMTGRLGKPNEEIKREWLTDEFFGFLGPILLYKSFPPSQREVFFKERPSLSEAYERQTKREVLDELAAQRETWKRLDLEWKLAVVRADKRRKQEVEREAEGGPAAEYYTTLTHYRGYAFAERVDPDRINNWKKFFSLPDKEIRRRFFTDKPDYSGL